jgi:O-antigen ligase
LITTAAICALAGLAATLSRGAILASIVGLGVVLYYSGTRRRWLAFAGMTGAIVVALAVFAGGRLVDQGGAEGEVTRLPIWRASVRMILDHPITGVGLDQFYYQYWRRYVEPGAWPERYTSHPHNLVLDVWLRLGILGLAAFGWLVVALALIARRLPRHSQTPPGGALAVASIAALVTGATHGLVDNGYFLPDLAVMTWFLIALFESQATGASTDPA